MAKKIVDVKKLLWKKICGGKKILAKKMSDKKNLNIFVMQLAGGRWQGNKIQNIH